MTVIRHFVLSINCFLLAYMCVNAYPWGALQAVYHLGSDLLVSPSHTERGLVLSSLPTALMFQIHSCMQNTDGPEMKTKKQIQTLFYS